MLVVSRILLTLVIILLVVAVGAPALADEIDLGSVLLRAHIIEIHHSLTKFRCAGDAELTQAHVRLNADEITADMKNGSVSATGNVLFSDLQGTIRAERIDYNFETAVGEIIRPVAIHGPVILRGDAGAIAPVLNDSLESEALDRLKPGVFSLSGASITTCDREKPDYRLTAREIELYPGEPPRLVARGVAVWFGGVRLMQLPNLNLPLSGDARAQRSLLPKLGFDGDDGFFVGYSMPLSVSDRNYLGFDARGTLKKGFQGGLFYERLLLGTSSGPLEIDGLDSQMELRYMPLLGFRQAKGLDRLKETPSQVRFFATADYRRKTHDLGEDRIWVSKLPEVGLKYHNSYGNSGLLGGFSQSAVFSYGRISEFPGLKDIGRFDARGIVSATPFALRHDTYLQPSVLLRHSGYDTGESYRVIAGSLDLVHAVAPESYTSIRLIQNYYSGTTPLQIDDVYADTELQGAFWRRFGPNIVGAQIAYDLSGRAILDWELTYGRTLHCMEPRITWRNRFRSISLDVRLLGF